MVELRTDPFEAADLLQMTMDEAQAAALKRVCTLDDLGRTFQRGGVAWTLRADGEIVGCGGVVVLWPGMGEAWAITSVLASEYPVACLRALRKGLQWAVKVHALWRVQAVVHEAVPVTGRWVERLGFRPEGEMQRYGPDRETYIRYAYLP